MRFSLQSLGGKLIISAALTLLLCLLLFAATSWFLLRAFYEHEAKSAATAHIALIQHAYQEQIALLARELQGLARDPTLTNTLAHPTTPARQQPGIVLLQDLQPGRFSTLVLVSSQQQILASANIPPGKLPNNLLPLLTTGLQGRTATIIVRTPGIPQNDIQYDIDIAV